MAQFHQEGQRVRTQYNADTISFGAVTTRADLIKELDKLVGRLDSVGAEQQQLDRKTTNEVRYRLSQAAAEAHEPAPDKSSMLQALNGAQSLLEKVPSAASAVTGLVSALSQAAQLVQIHF